MKLQHQRTYWRARSPADAAGRFTLGLGAGGWAWASEAAKTFTVAGEPGVFTAVEFCTGYAVYRVLGDPPAVQPALPGCE